MLIALAVTHWENAPPHGMTGGAARCFGPRDLRQLRGKEVTPGTSQKNATFKDHLFQHFFKHIQDETNVD